MFSRWVHLTFGSRVAPLAEFTLQPPPLPSPLRPSHTRSHTHTYTHTHKHPPRTHAYNTYMYMRSLHAHTYTHTHTHTHIQTHTLTRLLAYAPTRRVRERIWEQCLVSEFVWRLVLALHLLLIGVYVTTARKHKLVLTSETLCDAKRNDGQEKTFELGERAHSKSVNNGYAVEMTRYVCVCVHVHVHICGEDYPVISLYCEAHA
jgi:hypothetical protein